MSGGVGRAAKSGGIKFDPTLPTFENALLGTLGGKLGRKALGDEEFKDLWSRNPTPESPFAGFLGGQGKWQWSGGQGKTDEGLGEIFADQFVGWVYGGRFEDSELGTRRKNFMSSRMSVWVFAAILQRRGELQ